MKHPALSIRSFCLYPAFILLVITLCLNSSFVSKSFAEGLVLWYNNLVPLLLPFLLISGFFLSMIDWEHPNRAGCLILLFLCGLFCGYPVGAIAIGRLYKNQVISKDFAHAIMPLCNNISPMFLMGYVCNRYLNGQINTITVLAVIYLPQICYAILYYLLSKKQLSILHFKPIKKTAHLSSDDQPNHRIYLSETAGTLSEYATAQDDNYMSSVIENSITTITIIGIYVAIFSVLYDLVIAFTGGIPILHILACYLELTKGLSELSALSLSHVQKTALILSVTSFGGISSLCQSMHILKGTKLSFICYTFGKCICATFSYLIILLLLS